MNLKDIQLRKAIDEATIKYLRKGKFPTFSQVSSYVAEKFISTMAGLPSFKPLLGRKYQCSNPLEYNLMVDQIKSDLDDLYDADNYANNELLSAFNYYDVEKKRIDGMINSIENRLDNMLYGMTAEQTKESIFDNFDDFSKVDFIGNMDRGVSSTDAFIDLLTKTVSNDTLSNDSKISLKDATTKIQVPDGILSNTTLSDVANCLKDTVNESWIQQVNMETDTGVVIRLSIEFPEEQEVTTIRYQLQSPRSITIKLSTINSNKEVRNFKTVTTLDTAEWNIKRSKIKAITFEITKLEPDSLDGINYVYFIGAKNISIYNDFHKIKSCLISKPFKIKEQFNDVYLQVEQSLPPDTAMQFYVGVDTLDNQVGWVKVKNKKYNDIGLLDYVKINISGEFSPKFGDVYSNCYILTELKHVPSKNTTKLYIGNNMWERKTAAITDINTFQLKDLVTNGTLEYIKMDKIKFPQSANIAALYTTYVYCENPSVVESDIYNSQPTSLLSVYVNSIKIEKVDSKYLMRLASGWNKVQILSLTSANDELTINAYFNDISDIVRAKKDAITEVSVYDLLYNFHTVTYDYYAIMDKQLLVNFDPDSIGLEATVEYRYTDTPELFDKLHLRFMAVLESQSKDVTPKLSNYKIITS